MVMPRSTFGGIAFFTCSHCSPFGSFPNSGGRTPASVHSPSSCGDISQTDSLSSQ
jgi:hypothetical protein